ncbi:MAG: trypsin-like serine protease [Shinella sp.]|nr:trypsin-like serine protease [Shinella sp.]
MARNPTSSDFPLSPIQFRSAKISVSRHESERPASLDEQEAARRKIHTIKRTTGAVPDVAPSMPSYDETMNSAPRMPPISSPAHVLLNGHELEPLAIFHPDGRNLYDDRTFPWRCVCQVTSGTKTGCGVLIGPRHVLTASHVIDWNASGDSVRLLQGGTLIGTASSTDALAYEFISDVTYTNADDDYAILVLNARLGDGLGMLGARTYDSDWDNETANWFSIGYAPTLSLATPVFQTGFFLDEDDFDLGGGRMLITKTGDFERGMSGSPVFGFWDGGPFVVGVVSAGMSGLGNFNAIAAGSNLTRLVSQARSQFP